MQNPIKSITIHAYKGIKNLKLSTFSQFNVLTGANNSGKTSILELLYAVGRESNIYAWTVGTRSNRIDLSAFTRLFPVDLPSLEIGYTYEDANQVKTAISFSGQIESLRLPPEALGQMIGLPKRLIPTYFDISTDDPTPMIDTNCLHLSVIQNGTIIAQKDIFESAPHPLNGVNSNANIVYVPSSGRLPSRFWLDRILKDEHYYKLLLSALQDFDPSITRITSQFDQRTRQPEYMLLSSQHPTALPLSAYGDGMKKALALLAAVVQAENGLLLIDEFEIGIHTSAMDFVFDLVLSCARELNVQVFMTSHSEEAINKVLNSAPEIQQQLSLHTLFQYEGKSYCRTLSAKDALNARNHMGLELRA